MKNKTEIENRTEIEKRFQKTWKASLVFSILLIVLSVCCIGLGSLFFLLHESEAIRSGISLILLGAIHIPFGVWGISFSRQQQLEIRRDMIFVYRSAVDYKLLLGCSWFIGVCALIFFVIGFFFCVINGMTGIFFGLISAGIFFGTFYCFSSCRKERVVLDGNTMEHINAFGKKRVYDKSEIKWLLKNVPVPNGRGGCRYKGWALWGDDDEQIVMLYERMVNISRVADAFGDRIRDFREINGKKQEKILKESARDSFQTEHLKEIRIASRILFVVDLLIGAAVIFVYRNTDLLKTQHYYLLMELIQLTSFLFAWIFKDVVIWDDPSGRYLWSGSREQTKRYYVDIFVLQIMMLCLNMLFVILPMLVNLQCTRGSQSLFWVWLIFALLLTLISFGCVGRKRLKLYRQWLAILFFSAEAAWGMTDVTFLLTCKEPIHYVAEVTSTGKTHSYRGGTQYHAYVILRDGTEKRIMISQSVYRVVNDGEEVVICEREGILNTEFVTIHLP